jgi:hypothetical protein
LDFWFENKPSGNPAPGHTGINPTNLIFGEISLGQLKEARQDEQDVNAVVQAAAAGLSNKVLQTCEFVK